MKGKDMALEHALISDVIEFEGKNDDLVWKSPQENFNATSVLIVDEAHEAILVVNGNAADLFPPGRHVLETANIPLVRKLIQLPTDNKTSFPCKVFFLNKVHHLELLWGTQGPITLNDPLYDIFLHVGLCGTMVISVADSRKFLLKCVGLRDAFTTKELIDNFRGIISANVKNYISKIMINGMISYFTINANLFEIAEIVKEKLSDIFLDYGVKIEFFNIETITVPDNDYAAITASKERRTGRIIEGYSWQEERQMAIAERFAGNEGTMGSIGGAVGGFMVGGAFGGTLSDIARSALSESRIPADAPPRDASGKNYQQSGGSSEFNIQDFIDDSKGKMKPIQHQNSEILMTNELVDKMDNSVCIKCGALLPKGSVFCNKCGAQQVQICSQCGAELPSGSAFCNKCGAKTE